MMPDWFRTFWRTGAARITALAIGVGLLVLVMMSGHFMTGGADAAGAAPHIGGRFSEFTAAYGQPAKIGTGKGLTVNHVTVNGVRFYADRGNTIIVNAQPMNGTVKNLSITGPASWSDQQTVAYCRRFLAPGSTAFRSVGPYTYYHSNVGDTVVFNAGHGVCQVSLAPKYPPA